MAIALTAQPGLLETLLPATSLASAIGTGNPFALLIGSKGVPIIAWQTIFTGGNPASLTVLLEGSQDNVNWQTIDTSTKVTGEVRAVTGPYKFVRVNNSAVSSGAGITLTVYFTYAIQISTTIVDGKSWRSSVTGPVTTTGTTEEVLGTISLPIDALLQGSIWKRMRILAMWSSAANTRAKRRRVRLGSITGPALIDSNLTTSGIKILGISELFKHYADSPSLFWSGYTSYATNSAAFSEFYSLGIDNSVPLTGVVSLVVTGETSGAAGDLTLLFARVELDADTN